METIASPWLGFLRGVFLANHLAIIIDNLAYLAYRGCHVCILLQAS